MSSTRSIIAPPPFAANALTVIPPTPVAGVSYRDLAAGPASSPDGWPYAERVNSAEFNQIMFQMSTLLSIMDKKGVLGWSSLVDYTEASIQFGSDGLMYVWVAASGPNNGGAKDPISSPAFWIPFGSGRLIGVRVFSAVGATTYTPTIGTSSIIVEVQGGGGGGGGTSAQNASNDAVGTGGGGGGFSRSRLTSGFSGVSVVVGNGGAGGIAGNPGGSGGLSSFGGVIACTGGGGGLGSFGLAPPYLISGGLAGSGSGGNLINVDGGFGGEGFALSTVSGTSGRGGASNYGPGARPVVGNTTGFTATTPGSGGSASLTLANGAARNGGAGAPGIIYVYEYS